MALSRYDYSVPRFEDPFGDALYQYTAALYGVEAAEVAVAVGRDLRRITRSGTKRAAEGPIAYEITDPLPTNNYEPLPTNAQDVSVGQSSKSKSRMGYGSSLKRVRGGRKVTRNDPLKVSIKVERGLQQAAWNCVYVGGATHTTQMCTGMVVQSLIRFMALRANLDFASFDEDMIAPGIGAHSFSFDYWYRQDTGTGASGASAATALTLVTVPSTGITSWAQWAGAIADSFVLTFGTGPTTATPSLSQAVPPIRRLCYIALRGTATTPVLATQFYKADELFITVKGESKIQVQNRTKAENASGSEDAENVFANPLRGKYYTFKNGRPVVKSVANVQANQLTFFPYDTQSGNINVSDKEGVGGTVVFPGPVSNLMRKPPPGYWFSNCSTQKYTSLEPGHIARAAIQHTVTKSLNSWLSALRPKFLQATTKTYIGLGSVAQEGDPYEFKLGMSHMFALEKMCDTAVASSTNQVTVGLEHTLFVSGSLTWKPKMGCLPQVTINTI